MINHSASALTIGCHFVMQMCWHILLMCHHLQIHGDGLWYVKSINKLVFAEPKDHDMSLNWVRYFFSVFQASDQPFTVSAEEIDQRIGQRIHGDLLYLNGASFLSSATMNKTVYLSYVLIFPDDIHHVYPKNRNQSLKLRPMMVLLFQVVE